MMLGVDSSGVEVLSGEDIEERATKVLRALAPQVLSLPPRMVPVENFIWQLARDGRLEYEPAAQLDDGLLGKCWFRPTPRIAISARLTQPGRRRFVLGHELGHFVLHRELRVVQRDYVVDDEASVFGDPPARRWMEWQANRFAAALLMPMHTIADVVRQAIAETQRVAPERRRYQIATYVAAFYDVGKTAARRRVEEIEKLAAQSS